MSRMQKIQGMEPRSVKILANNAMNQRDEALVVLEMAFVAMGRLGANASTDHPLRDAWVAARKVLKANGRLA